MITTEITQSKPSQPQSFESSLSELEAIIAAMEVGQMSLQETLDAYKRGISLLRQCQDTLNAAERQTRILESNVLHDLNPEIPDQQEE